MVSNLLDFDSRYSAPIRKIVGSEAMHFSIVYLLATPFADRLATAKTALTAAIEAGFDLRSLCGVGKYSDE